MIDGKAVAGDPDQTDACKICSHVPILVDWQFCEACGGRRDGVAFGTSTAAADKTLGDGTKTVLDNDFERTPSWKKAKGEGKEIFVELTPKKGGEYQQKDGKRAQPETVAGIEIWKQGPAGTDDKPDKVVLGRITKLFNASDYVDPDTWKHLEPLSDNADGLQTQTEMLRKQLDETLEINPWHIDPTNPHAAAWRKWYEDNSRVKQYKRREVKTQQRFEKIMGKMKEHIDALEAGKAPMLAAPPPGLAARGPTTTVSITFDRLDFDTDLSRLATALCPVLAEFGIVDPPTYRRGSIIADIKFAAANAAQAAKVEASLRSAEFKERVMTALFDPSEYLKVISWNAAGQDKHHEGDYKSFFADSEVKAADIIFIQEARTNGHEKMPYKKGDVVKGVVIEEDCEYGHTNAGITLSEAMQQSEAMKQTNFGTIEYPKKAINAAWETYWTILAGTAPTPAQPETPRGIAILYNKQRLEPVKASQIDSTRASTEDFVRFGCMEGHSSTTRPGVCVSTILKLKDVAGGVARFVTATNVHAVRSSDGSAAPSDNWLDAVFRGQKVVKGSMGRALKACQDTQANVELDLRKALGTSGQHVAAVVGGDHNELGTYMKQYGGASKLVGYDNSYKAEKLSIKKVDTLVHATAWAALNAGADKTHGAVKARYSDHIFCATGFNDPSQSLSRVSPLEELEKTDDGYDRGAKFKSDHLAIGMRVKIVDKPKVHLPAAAPASTVAPLAAAALPQSEDDRILLEKPNLDSLKVAMLNIPAEVHAPFYRRMKPNSTFEMTDKFSLTREAMEYSKKIDDEDVTLSMANDLNKVS